MRWRTIVSFRAARRRAAGSGGSSATSAPARAGGSRCSGLQIFLLLTAYYLLKTVREPLILLWGVWGLQGDELKIYATSAQALLLLGSCCRSTARWRRRVHRLALVRFTLIGFIASLALFIVLGIAERADRGAVLHVARDRQPARHRAVLVARGRPLHAARRASACSASSRSAARRARSCGAQLARRLIEPIGIYGLMVDGGGAVRGRAGGGRS